MKYFVNWIPANTHVVQTKPNPALKRIARRKCNHDFEHRLSDLYEMYIYMYTYIVFDHRLSQATRCYACHDRFTCVTWLIHMCDMTGSYVWHDWFMCIPGLIHTPYSYVGHDSFICVKWFIHMWDITHSYTSCVNTDLRATWLFHKCDRTAAFDTHINVYIYLFIYIHIHIYIYIYIHTCIHTVVL